MKLYQTVQQLLQALDRDKIASAIVQAHYRNHSAEKQILDDYKKLIGILCKTVVEESNQVLLVQPTNDGQVTVVPIDKKNWLRFEADSTYQLPDPNSRTQVLLQLSFWPKVLGMSIAMAGFLHCDDSTHQYSLAATIVYDLGFFGLTAKTHKHSLASFQRLSYLSDSPITGLHPVTPWFVPEAAIDIDRIIDNITATAGEQYTLWGIYADIWGIPDWSANDYLILCAIFAIGAPRSGAETMPVHLTLLTNLARCSRTDVISCLKRISKQFVWTLVDGVPHKARLFDGYLEQNDFIIFTLDPALRKLYALLSKHYLDYSCVFRAAMISFYRVFDASLHFITRLDLQGTYQNQLAHIPAHAYIHHTAPGPLMPTPEM